MKTEYIIGIGIALLFLIWKGNTSAPVISYNYPEVFI